MRKNRGYHLFILFLLMIGFYMAWNSVNGNNYVVCQSFKSPFYNIEAKIFSHNQVFCTEEEERLNSGGNLAVYSEGLFRIVVESGADGETYSAPSIGLYVSEPINNDMCRWLYTITETNGKIYSISVFVSSERYDCMKIPAVNVGLYFFRVYLPDEFEITIHRGLG